MNRQQREEATQRIIARFRQLKADEQWTQETLAEESGVKLRTISDILRGKAVPNPETLDRLAGALGLHLTPGEVRASWSPDIIAFQDIIGLYLSGLPSERRGDVMRQITEGILGGGHLT
jgi:transcriptional regulator with XRE-family HTH domain